MEKLDKSLLHDAVVCKEEDSVLEVSRIMRDTKARHVIVINEDTFPIGIISPFDISNRLVAEEKDANETYAKDIMTKPIETIDINSNYKEASEKMVALETYTIPVTEGEKLIGILDYSVVFRKVCEVKENDKE